MAMNEISLVDDNTLGLITKSKELILIDKEDWKRVRMFSWYVTGDGYGVTSSFGPCFQIHQLIMSFPIGLIVDHITRNKLDNRKINLRSCTYRQNIANQGLRAMNKTGFKGVSKSYNGKFVVSAVVGDSKKYLGTFETAIEAAMVYDCASYKTYGDFAYLNFPENKEKYATETTGFRL